ncbi:unnamed protein product [Leuciscus chuanchicus]
MSSAQFVKQNESVLIQRVISVMPIADELKNKGMIHPETYEDIKAEITNRKKMRKLYEALEAGGDRVKHEFYYALANHEKFLFRDLECNEHTNGLFSFLHSVCGLKSVELMIFSLNQSWALRILSLIQTFSSLQEIQ